MALVYKHTSPNGKIYIGMTKQKDAEVRWLGGFGYSENSDLFNDIVKYGWDNFKHEIVQDGLSEEDAHILEVKMIEETDAENPDIGYNRTEYKKTKWYERITKNNLFQEKTKQTGRKYKDAMPICPICGSENTIAEYVLDYSLEWGGYAGICKECHFGFDKDGDYPELQPTIEDAVKAFKRTKRKTLPDIQCCECVHYKFAHFCDLWADDYREAWQTCFDAKRRN